MAIDMEKQRARGRRYYLRHRQVISEARKKRRKEFPQEAKAEARAHYLRNRERIIARAIEWRRRNWDKAKLTIKAKAAREIDRRRARGTLKKAVHDRRIAKPTICSLCNVDKGEKRLIHGHHHDYNQPYAVTWVCARCHPSLHGF